jgi:hypothetical protein
MDSRTISLRSEVELTSAFSYTGHMKEATI